MPATTQPGHAGPDPRPAAVAWTGTRAAHGQLLDHRPARLAGGLASGCVAAELTWYLSTGLHGGPVIVTGIVMTPHGEPPPGGWPVIAWGAGGFGVCGASAYTRSERLNHGHDAYTPFLAGLLAAGYAITASDYEGQISGGVRPFQAPHSEGRSMIDAVLAGRQLNPALGTGWFAVGHSGGGHAALDAAETADTGYAPGLSLLGVVALEPAGNFSWVPGHLDRLIIDDPRGAAGRAIYAALVIGLKAQHPGLRLADYLGPLALAQIGVAYTGTAEASARALAGLPSAEFGPRTPEAAAQMRAWLEANAVPRQKTSVPVFFPTGAPQAARPMVKLSHDKARQLGDTVLTTLYPAADHHQMIAACQDDVLQWLRDRLRGQPPPSG
jgi:Secretory lipase